MSTPITAKVAERVEALRSSRGMPVVILAEKTGMARTTLQRCLAGHSDFNVPDIIRVAKVLDSTTYELIGDL